MELAVTILLNLFGLIGTAIAISFALVGKDVIRAFDSIEAQDLPELKRRMARCLMLAVWAIIAIPVASILAILMMSRSVDSVLPEAPWWLGLALLPGAFAGYRALEFVFFGFGSLMHFASQIR